MTPFAYHRASSAADALGAMRPGARYLAGGTSLIDLMKTGVEAPDLLVDLNRGAGLGGLEWLPDSTLRAGAAVRMTALARDSQAARRFPVLHQALLALRASHNCGTKCHVPALEEGVETAETPGDGFRAGWLVAA